MKEKEDAKFLFSVDDETAKNVNSVNISKKLLNFNKKIFSSSCCNFYFHAHD